jgi:sugar/nucleoside kinase (ribokinase family)
MVEFFREGLQAMIGDKVDLLFCNEDEAMGWTDTDDLNLAIERLKTIAATFAVTRGDKGAVIFDGEQLITIAANQVKAIDTNGAGDMFAGAFLYAITHGHNYKAAGELASLASATVVSRYGPRLPTAMHTKLLAALTA